MRQARQASGVLLKGKMSQPFDNRDYDVREIERLNAEVLDLTDRLHWQVNENEFKRKLIGELADALSRYIDNQSENNLLQRARKAIKTT
jgi:hypothetical protein